MRDRDRGKVSGLFELKTADDLFEKLKRDHTALQASPLDSGCAYNFVVTAWHLHEWLPEEGERVPVRDRHPILRVCEHLAVGAKHFVPIAKRHKSVADTERRDGAWGQTWGQSWGGAWGDRLVIHLDGDARRRFGPILTVLELAELVMDVWAEELEG